MIVRINVSLPNLIAIVSASALMAMQPATKRLIIFSGFISVSYC